MIPASWMIKHKDEEWTNEQRREATKMIHDKHELYQAIDTTDEARKQLQKARTICRKKGINV